MEWIIGLIIVWVIWRLLTGEARREISLKDAIHRAYIANTRLGQGWIDTPIYWEAAEKFAQERGANESGGGYLFDMLVNKEKVTVRFIKNYTNGTVTVSALGAEEFQQLIKRMETEELYNCGFNLLEAHQKIEQENIKRSQANQNVNNTTSKSKKKDYDPGLEEYLKSSMKESYEENLETRFQRVRNENSRKAMEY